MRRLVSVRGILGFELIIVTECLDCFRIDIYRGTDEVKCQQQLSL